MTLNPESFALGIVVLNYRTPELVIDCLGSLCEQVKEGHQVVVVDNCSGDDSPDMIEDAINANGWSDWAMLVRSPVNGGFAAGNNVGIKEIDASVYLLLNSDTIVRSESISSMLRTMRDHPDIHMLAPRLEWPDGEYQISTFRYRTPISELLYSSKLGVLGRLFPRHVVARELNDWTTGIDWVSFACIAIRHEVIDEIGLLDEQYFMYFEDMAYCRKATHAGFTIAYQPDASVVHLRGGSSPVKEATRNRKRRPKYYAHARSHYFRTFYGILGHVLANVMWTLGFLLGALRGRTGAVEKEWVDIWASPDFSKEKSA
jgi:N-acetylglucosaminyl-diphospho-decaprenol L-rhamnosyltransferase